MPREMYAELSKSFCRHKPGTKTTCAGIEPIPSYTHHQKCESKVLISVLGVLESKPLSRSKLPVRGVFDVYFFLNYRGSSF